MADATVTSVYSRAWPRNCGNGALQQMFIAKEVDTQAEPFKKHLETEGERSSAIWDKKCRSRSS